MTILARLFRQRSRLADVAADPIYAIGDVHGRSDLLEALLANIAADADSAGLRAYEIIFLGDYVDRGPDSRGVIDLIINTDANPSIRVTALKGNHEETMLQFLQDADVGPVWTQYGGAATLSSYDVSPPDNRMIAEEWERARRELAAALPEAHRALLASLPLYTVRGDYLFVHAGIRPGIPVAEQAVQDLLWIRGDFLDSRKRLAHTVVHGHTTASMPQNEARRICVDTGAYRTGRLTAVRLIGAERAFLQAEDD